MRATLTAHNALTLLAVLNHHLSGPLAPSHEGSRERQANQARQARDMLEALHDEMLRRGRAAPSFELEIDDADQAFLADCLRAARPISRTWRSQLSQALGVETP